MGNGAADMSEPVGRTILGDNRQDKLNKLKRQTRINNEQYFRAHPELRTMVKAFMAELLEKQPEDVRAAAQAFFTDPALARKLGLTGWSRPLTPDILVLDGEPEPEEEPVISASTGAAGDELEQKLIGLFKMADADGSGNIDGLEFMEVMRSANLGLSDNAIKRMFHDAKSDADGMIGYEQFVPVAVEVIQSLALKDQMASFDPDAITAEERAACVYSISGMTEVEFIDTLERLVQSVNEPSGRLTRGQIKTVVSSSHLRLQPMHINMVMMDLRLDADGKIEVAYAGPAVYQVLLNSVADSILSRLSPVHELAAEITESFQSLSPESPLIEPRTARAVLGSLFPFLSKLQANTIMSEAIYTDEGMLDWPSFAKIAATMVEALCDPKAMLERQEAATRAQFTPLELLGYNEQDEITAMLKQAFIQHDTDGNRQLDHEEFQKCIKSTGLELSTGDIFALMDMGDTDGDGTISYSEFEAIAHGVLLHLHREKAINKQLKTLEQL